MYLPYTSRGVLKNISYKNKNRLRKKKVDISVALYYTKYILIRIRSSEEEQFAHNG